MDVEMFSRFLLQKYFLRFNIKYHYKVVRVELSAFDIA